MDRQSASEQPAALWPDRERWQAWLRFTGFFCLLFFPVYAGAGALAAASGRAAGLYADWEQQIPFLPWMVWPYLSLFPLYLLPLFCLPPQSIAVLSRQSTFCLLLAGAVFVLLPTRSGFAPLPAAGLHAPVFALIGLVDTPHNLAPSLHVTFGAIILLACAAALPGRAALACRLWLPVMAASTVFVHQHHLLDAAAGLALALTARRLFALPRLTPARADAAAASPRKSR